MKTISSKVGYWIAGLLVAACAAPEHAAPTTPEPLPGLEASSPSSATPAPTSADKSADSTDAPEPEAPVPVSKPDDSSSPPPPSPEGQPHRDLFHSCVKANLTCKQGSQLVQSARLTECSCVPVLEQNALLETPNLEHPVIVNAPRIEYYHRHLTCKSIPCGYPGATLPLDTGKSLPLVHADGTTVACNRGRPTERNEAGCPNLNAKKLLGIVHAGKESGDPGTFEVLGFE